MVITSNDKSVTKYYFDDICLKVKPASSRRDQDFSLGAKPKGQRPWAGVG